MVSIKKDQWVVRIGDKLVFLLDNTVDGKDELREHVVLMPMVGEDMTYETDIKQIDYPGEYEIQGITIKAWADAHGLLSYVLWVGKYSIVLVQSKQFLESEDDLPEDIYRWIFTTTALRDYRQKCEFEWEYVDLEQLVS